MHRLTVMTIFLAASIVTACGESAPDPVGPPVARIATLAELRGAWQAAPFALDPQILGRVEQACRRDMEVPAGGRLAIVDVRGAAVVTVRITGVMASCDALEITADGQVTGAGSGSSGGAERLAPLGPAELVGVERTIVGGGDLKVEGWSVHGRVGGAIAAVEVVPRNGAPVIATLMNGWFAAWWPAGPNQHPLIDQSSPPFAVRAYDAGGLLVAEQ
jgi:hypothetical protein